MDALIQESMQRLIDTVSADDAAVWPLLEEGGFTLIWLPEEQGGFGLAMEDGFGLVRQLAKNAVSAPLAETLLGGWLLMAAGLKPQAGPLCVATGGRLRDGRLSGEYHRVAFGESARLVCLTDDGFVALASGVEAKRVSGIGLDPVADLFATDCEVVSARASEWLSHNAFMALAAIMRSAQICGALETVLEMTVAFVQERHQFGRPLAKFQAIQGHLAVMASQVAAASAATEAAVAMTTRDGAPDLAAATVAKMRTSEAAGIVCALAHQCHGAIGYAAEFRLGAFTRRLWQWRESFGNEGEWALKLADAFLANRIPIIERTLV